MQPISIEKNAEAALDLYAKEPAPKTIAEKGKGDSSVKAGFLGWAHYGEDVVCGL